MIGWTLDAFNWMLYSGSEMAYRDGASTTFDSFSQRGRRGMAQ